MTMLSIHPCHKYYNMAFRVCEIILLWWFSLILQGVQPYVVDLQAKPDNSSRNYLNLKHGLEVSQVWTRGYSYALCGTRSHTWLVWRNSKIFIPWPKHVVLAFYLKGLSGEVHWSKKNSGAVPLKLKLKFKDYITQNVKVWTLFCVALSMCKLE